MTPHPADESVVGKRTGDPGDVQRRNHPPPGDDAPSPARPPGGATNADIAQRLCVSVERVRTHVQRILGKLRVATRQEAATRVRS